MLDKRKQQLLMTLFLLGVFLSTPVCAAPMASCTVAESQSFDAFVNILFLRDYNTRLVVGATAVLGAAGGMVGSFLLLRKRALMSDVLSHATLPGIGAAFMLAVASGGDGK